MLYSKIADHESSFVTNKKDSGGTSYTFNETTYGEVDVTELTPSGVSDYYYNDEVDKKSIAIHFTAGYIKGDLQALCKNDYHVSVPFLIARSGTIYKLFDPDKWSYHLGSGAVGGNTTCSKKTIAIEISNIGPLVKNGNQLDTTYGTGDKYCDLTDTDAFVELEEEYRGYKYFATFTQEQYDSLNLLLDELCDDFDIPKTFLEESVRHDVFASATEAQDFEGICTHVNYRSSGKWDIGPGFGWDQLITPTLKIPSALEWSLPVKLKDTTDLTKENLDAYFKHTEKENPGGYFPIAMNSTWHGGLHLNPKEGDEVCSMAPGKVIAARLIDKEDLQYGSRNFILMQHTLQEKTWYSLYYHLQGFTEASKDGIPWLQEISLKLKEETAWYLENGTARDNALSKGATVECIEKREDNWIKVRYQSKEGFVQLTSEQYTETKTPLDFKNALKEVQMFDAFVPAGTLLGKVGHTKKSKGESTEKVPCLHWEVFSSELLPGHWQQVKDEMPQVQCDNDVIKKLIDKAALNERGIFSKDGQLTPKEIEDFYKSDNAKQLRNFACSTYSEWAMDWPKQKELLSQMGYDLKASQLEAMLDYNFWTDIALDGFPQAVVWHYSPLGFLQKQLGSNYLLPIVGSPFDSNKSFLLPSHVAALAIIAEHQKEYTIKETVVLCHHGVDQDTSSAQELSQKRAECVASILSQDKDSFVTAFSKEWNVWELQRCLAYFKDDEGKPMYGMIVDGIGGNGTKGAIRKFQEKYKLDVDGIAGKQTYGKIFDLFVELTGSVKLEVQAKGCGRTFSDKKEGVIEIFLRDGEGSSFQEVYEASENEGELLIRQEKAANLKSIPVFAGCPNEGDFVFYLGIDKFVGLNAEGQTVFADQQSSWQEAIRKETYILKDENDTVVDHLTGDTFCILAKEEKPFPESETDYWVLHFKNPKGNSFSLLHQVGAATEEESTSERFIFEKLPKADVLKMMEKETKKAQTDEK